MSSATLGFTTKPSGIPWLGEVPAHWEVKRLKYVADVRFSNVDKKTEDGEVPVKLCNYTDVYYGHYLDGTPEYMEASASASEIARFKLYKGDVLITKDSESSTDIAIAAMVVEDVPDLVCGYHLAMIRTDREQLDPAFLYWQFLSDQVREQYYPLANGITRFALGHGDITGGNFVVPPLPEQRAIAAFLDERTARIDGLVARKQRLVQLLKEKRQAHIARVVTRGLDAKVKLKESGVPWLGEVPEHWGVKPLKWFATCKSGDGISSDDIDREPTEASIIPVIGGNGLSGYTSESNTARRVIVIGRVGALCGNVHLVGAPAWISDNALVLQPDPNTFDQDYLAHVLRIRDLNQIAAKTAQPLITGTQVSDQRLPTPSILEQRRIAAYITTKTADLDALATKVEAAMERLQEYRTALISAAVTGKVRVG